MSRSLGNVIADTLQFSLGYAERLLTGVGAEQFARLGAPGGVKVNSNHAAFIYGHLALYPEKIVSRLGVDGSHLAAPASFHSVFAKDAVCRDDPAGAIYPAMAEVTKVFFDGHRAALTALRATPDTVLEMPNDAGGRMSELFPTMAGVQAFYVGGHFMLHMGQMSAWRRMMGLGAA